MSVCTLSTLIVMHACSTDTCTLSTLIAVVLLHICEAIVVYCMHACYGLTSFNVYMYMYVFVCVVFCL